MSEDVTLECPHSSLDQSADDHETLGISRRDFARDLAVAAAGLALVPTQALAQKKQKTAAPAKPPVTDEPDLSAQAKTEAESSYEAVLRKYGTRLSNEQKSEVRRLLMQQQKSIELVRKYKIENGNGPATVLHLVTEEAR